MKKNRRFIVWEIMFFLIAYLINIFPYANNGNYQDEMSFLFLNFDNFEKMGFDKFNPQFIIMFLIFIYINCIKILSIENENNSFKSMYLIKFTKKKVIKKIVKEHIACLGMLGTISYLLTLFFHFLLTFFVATKEINWMYFLIVLVYIIRIYSILIIINIIYSINCLIKVKNEILLLLSIVLVLFIFIDLFFGQSFVTLSNNLKIEVMLYFFELSVLYCFYLYTKWNFFNKEDLFND